jgi:hypothetical protein
LLCRFSIVLQPSEFPGSPGGIKNGYAKLIGWRSDKTAIYVMRIARLNECVYILSDGKNAITAWPLPKRLNELRWRMRNAQRE